MTPKATAVGQALRARLAEILPANGYFTELRGVFGPADPVRDAQPKPYALVRPAHDARTGVAVFEATRVRTYEIEVVFGKSAGESDLDAVHIDILRALGFGQDDHARMFPGLLEDEDEASYRYASDGETTHSITLSLGVLYVERYN